MYKYVNFKGNKEKAMGNIITPKKLQGFMELDPIKQRQFDQMQKKIIEVFERYSFLPINTPTLEYSEILLAKSGGEIDKEIYRFTKGSTDICMRYDLTVPLARYVAMNLNNLNFPFRRYQIGKVYRGERPQKGRFREFIQCDADIIGVDNLSLTNDAECVSLYIDCFNAIDLDVIVEVSNRKIVNGLISALNLNDKAEEIFKNLDKADKIGHDEFVKNLRDLQIEEKSLQKILNLSKCKGQIDEVVKILQKICDEEEFLQGVNELKQLDSYLKALGLTEKDYIFNLSIVRGHNYYTGTVFEAYLKDHRDFGAVGGGGRYDNLASYYTTTKLPGVGMSIGFTRLFDQLASNNLLPEINTAKTEVIVIPLGDTVNYSLNLCKQLRDKKIATEISSENKSFKAKLKDANKRLIPFVLIVGEDEVNSQNYTLKNMQTGEQFKLTLSEIVEKIK